MFPPGTSPPGARKPSVRLAQNIPGPDVDHKLLCGIPAGYGDTRFWGLHDCKTPHCRKTPPVRGRRSDPDHHPLKLCCSGSKRTMTDCLGHPFENLHWVLDTYYFISTCDHNKVCQVIYAVPEYQRYYAPIPQPDVLPEYRTNILPEYRADILPEKPADILPGYFVDGHITGGEGLGENIVLWA